MTYEEQQELRKQNVTKAKIAFVCIFIVLWTASYIGFNGQDWMKPAAIISAVIYIISSIIFIIGKLERP
jgi:fatty-acid desaturase